MIPFPESVSSCLGSAIHTVVNRVVRGEIANEAAEIRAAVSGEFVRLVSRQSGPSVILAALGVPVGPAVLLPASRFVDKMRVALRAADVVRSRAAPFGRFVVRQGASVSRPEEGRAGNERPPQFGTEIVLASTALDLDGRADLVEAQSGGGVRITEFKTGGALDEAGTPKEAHLLQVCAYALVVRAWWPEAPVALRIVSADGVWEQPFTSELVERASAVLTALKAQLPPAATRTEIEIAHPGASCASCRFRPSCGPYKSLASARWTRPDDIVPHDVWGRLETVDRGTKDLLDLRVRDEAGRKVRISNVPSVFVGGASVGEYIEAFGLASSEAGRGSSAPCNFHVVNAHRPYLSAFGATVVFGEARSN